MPLDWAAGRSALGDTGRTRSVGPVAEPVRPRSAVIAGVVATVLGMVSVQSGAAIAIGLFSSVGALGVVALRLGGGATFLVSTSRPPLRRLTRREVLPLAGLGVVIACMNASF